MVDGGRIRPSFRFERGDVYLCPFCGDIEFGKVPDKCPSCGAPAAKFQKIQ